MWPYADMHNHWKLSATLLLGLLAACQADQLEETEQSTQARVSETSAPVARSGAGGLPSRPMSTLYSARSLADQRRLAATATGVHRVDAAVLQAHGENLCSYLATEPYSTLKAIAGAGKLPSDSASMKSYEIVDGFRASYCGSETGSSASEGDADKRALLLAAKTGDPGARAVLDVYDAVIYGSEEVDASDAAQQLSKVFRTTNSPALMQKAGELMVSDGVGFQVPGFDSAGLDANERLTVANVGVGMAVCLKFGTCHQRNVYSVRVCMPASCRGNGSLDDYFRAILSPVEYEAAQRYARALARFQGA